MSRMVFCKKYGEELEGLDAPPYPGPKGQVFFVDQHGLMTLPVQPRFF